MEAAEQRTGIGALPWAAVLVALVAGLPITIVGECMLWALAPHVVEGAWVVILPGFMVAIGGLGMCASACGLAWALRRDPPTAPRWLTRAAVCGTFGYTPAVVSGVAWMLWRSRLGAGAPPTEVDRVVVLGCFMTLAVPSLVLARLVLGPRLSIAGSRPEWSSAPRSVGITGIVAALALIASHRAWPGPRADRELRLEEMHGTELLPHVERLLEDERSRGHRWLQAHLSETSALYAALRSTVPRQVEFRIAGERGPEALRRVAREVSDPLARRTGLLRAARESSTPFRSRYVALLALADEFIRSRDAREPLGAVPARLAEALVDVARHPHPVVAWHRSFPGATGEAEAMWSLACTALLALTQLPPSFARSVSPALREIKARGDQQAAWARRALAHAEQPPTPRGPPGR